MLGTLLSRVLIITFGFLYPAYSSFKTIRSANVKQYVRWMMYWVVFALFTASEYFCGLDEKKIDKEFLIFFSKIFPLPHFPQVADVFISWLPFYYEIKVLFVIWLSSTYTRGASIVYRKVLHPLLARKERHIDKWIDQKQGQSLDYLVTAGKKGIAAAASGAMGGVAALQGKTGDENFTATVAATGLLSSVVNTVGSIGSGLASAGQGGSNGSESRPSSGGSGSESRKKRGRRVEQEEQEEEESFEEWFWWGHFFG